MTLLDAITEAAGDPKSPALRKFSASMLAEFLKWSIKQGSRGRKEKKAADKTNINVRSLMRRIHLLLRHSSAFKRLGGCLAISNIYRTFREEGTLVSRYTLELIDVMLSCLATAHRDQPSLGTKTEAISVLRKLERIISDPAAGHHKILEKKTDKREGESHCLTLTLFVEWLFGQLGRLQDDCRRSVMMLFEAFAPLVKKTFQKSGSNTQEGKLAWFRFYLTQHGLDKVVEVFENGGAAKDSGDSQSDHSVGAGSPLRVPIFPHDFENGNPRFLHWLGCVAASLDSYTWVISKGFIPDALKGEHHIFSETVGSELLDTLRHFLEEVVRDHKTLKWARNLS
eukprot:211461-Amorphochlora_amoeboformis.AAC.1